MKYLAFIVYYPLTWIGTLLLCIAGLIVIITDFINEKLELQKKQGYESICDIVGEQQENIDEEELRNIAVVETVAIRNQGYDDFYEDGVLWGILSNVAVNSFLKGYHYNKAKEEK